MNYVEINRLRGNVADYTRANGMLRVAFNHVGPTVDLTDEKWGLFIEELKEAKETFALSANSTESYGTSGSENADAIDGDLDSGADDDL